MRELFTDEDLSDLGEKILGLKRETTHIEIWNDNDKNKPFVLWWTDYVANDWTERFESLPLVMLRMTALLACEESDWSKGFTTDPENFSITSLEVLDNLAR